MRFFIKHDAYKRLRIHFDMNQMTFREADILQFYLDGIKEISSSKVYERTADAVILYDCDKNKIINALREFNFENVNVPEEILENSGREINSLYQEKLVTKVLVRYTAKIFVPMPIRRAIILAKSLKYIKNGLGCLSKAKIEVPVLDATAIGVSILRSDFETAGSVMFLLGIGEIMEEWTHKKSVDDLAKTMSLNISKAWLLRDGQEVCLPVNEIKEGDLVVVHMGTVIPFDGVVVSGEAVVNQASLTGEAEVVRKAEDSLVYAGTVLEEGEITIRVTKTSGLGKFDQIVKMIEESEKLKSGVESKAEHLADSLVPYSLGATFLTYLLTRNATKALSILMVDFSCAIKLAMPISVLTAIKQGRQNQINIKGGKFLEAVAEANTIVFDKTGTLTKATPTVKSVVSFNGASEDELLRIAACLEEHFPHSMANAVVFAAKLKNLEHEEMHSKVEYIVAHGISSYIGDNKVVIGSYHFVFEDEKCVIPEGKEELFNNLPLEYSHLYMAVNGKLAAVICIEDPVREEAANVINRLKHAGFEKIVMMTGDSYRTAKAIANKVGVTEFYAEVLPEDKARFVEEEKAKHNKVIMVGDGINDSPALSAADVGVAISEGAEIAREIADITISANDLESLVILKNLSNEMMRRISKNYNNIVGFNASLIALGVAGVLQPTTSALLHNISTIAFSLKSMESYLLEEK
ncbi:MAG: heavy metal translocating P-type ATPase [Lachnospira sp.]|nr:heavy metal translocating P-type ATPase [Lachnospira sp.]